MPITCSRRHTALEYRANRYNPRSIPFDTTRDFTALSTLSYLYAKPPVWRRQNCPTHTLPDDLRPWLDERGSLTKRLRGVFGMGLRVDILLHGWKPAFNDECRVLAVAHHRYHLIREVVLSVGDTPLVLARTVLPQATIRIAQRNLSHLGTRPLGEVIFAYPDLERRQRAFSTIATANWSNAVRARFDVDQPLWARRTLYAIHRQPLLVMECFLPALRQLCQG